MNVKRSVKWIAGRASVALSPIATLTHHRACVLVYHRIANLHTDDPHRDSWNVPPALFERHMAALAGWADIVRLDELPAALCDAGRAAHRPRVAVTFDDGYASVCTEALPILRRYGVPATAFVVTSCVGSSEPMPFDRWSRFNANHAPVDVWRPLTWQQIEQCAASGLIAIGSHSHWHQDGRFCSLSQLQEEAGTSRETLRSRLDATHARSYAYPYGSSRLGHVHSIYVDVVRAAGYEQAVSTDLGLVTARSNPYLLPRVEATAVDSPATIRAKVRGSLMPLRVTDWLRRADRTA